MSMIILQNSCYSNLNLRISLKPGSHMLPMYVRRSRRYHLGYFSDKWEHVLPATGAIAELYRRHACEVELKSTSQACWQRLLFSYRNSILGSAGGHIADASVAHENQALYSKDLFNLNSINPLTPELLPIDE